MASRVRCAYHEPIEVIACGACMFEKLKALCEDEIQECERNVEKFLRYKNAATNKEEDRMVWQFRFDDAVQRAEFWKSRLRQIEETKPV